ncbi:SIR2 family protein [Mycobacterium avium]|uniref:SIR2 family protein n=1 Tax=Mycobacterium avium TaxID=1764 RepID=UPI000A032E9F|nr:SIR2 family protein [Mycobacterium avium]
MPIERFGLVEEFGEAVLSGNAALFIGAGLSRDAGLPGWGELLDPIRRRCNIPEHRDLPLVAEYIVNDPGGGRRALEDHILAALTQPLPSPARSHCLVARLRVPEVWTTNYDPLIEKAMASAGFEPALAVDEATIQQIASNNPRTVIKMHGSIGGNPPGWVVPPVITRTDYERYEADHQRMWTVLRASYLSRVMLFLGFSFTDPNVEILLRLARTLGTAAEDRHIAVIKHPGVDAGDDARLHELRMADLENSGVRVCEITKFDENTEILTQLLRRTRPERLFVSGSSARPDTTAEEDEQILDEWCLAMARELDGETTWEIASLGGPAGWLITRDVARLRRINGRYDPAKLTFHFREKAGEPPAQLQERVGTVNFTDMSRETLVVSLLAESRALLAIRGGERTAEEIDWAAKRDVGVVPLACSGGAAQAYWAAHRDNPPELGGLPTDPGLWERLNNPDAAVAAEAAHQLLAQAMYQR